MLQAPAVYPDLPPSAEGFPAQFAGHPSKTFGGVLKGINKVLPSSSGSNVGPNGSFQFLIGTGGSAGYLLGNTMQLRFKLTVTQTASDTGPAAWAFAPQESSGAIAASAANQGWGSAHSLFNRISVTVGNVTIPYSQYGKYAAIMMGNCTAPEYILNDAREAYMAGTFTKNNAAGSTGPASTTVWISMPLLLPIFQNSNAAVPLFLLNGAPLTVELFTESIAAAFTTITNPITNYSISDAALTWVEAQPSYELVTAVKAAVAERGSYAIPLQDYASLGQLDQGGSVSYTLGANLSSLRAVIGTNVLTAEQVVTAGTVHRFVPNGLSQLIVQIDGEVVSSQYAGVTERDTYASFQQSVQSLYDTNGVSYLAPTASSVATSIATRYGAGCFAWGVNTSCFADWAFSSGRPAQNVTIQYLTSASLSAIDWSVTTAAAAGSMFPFLLFDSVILIDASGQVQYRR